MITGRKAFEGTSPSGVIAAILSSAPPPMSALRATVPPALDHVVKDCLAKDPDARWQAAGDIGRELKWIADTPPPSLTAAAARTSARTVRYWIGAAALTALAAGMSTFLYFRRVPSASSRVQLFLPPPEHTAYPNYSLVESPPVVSPDGRQVAFVAHAIGGPDTVWVRSFDSLTARTLPGTDGVPSSSLSVFWSPDGRSLGFFATGKLKRVDLAGGPPRILADAPDGRGGTWNQQGIIVFAPTGDGPLSRVAATGGPITPATSLRPPQVGHRWPVFLPDGRHFLYLNRMFPQLRDSSIDIASLDSADVVHALSGGTTNVNATYKAEPSRAGDATAKNCFMCQPKAR